MIFNQVQTGICFGVNDDSRMARGVAAIIKKDDYRLIKSLPGINYDVQTILEHGRIQEVERTICCDSCGPVSQS